MKSLLLLVALSVPSSATPYFRFINPTHPQPVAGALIASDNLNQSEGAALLPLVTHSPNDGCLLPNIVCENWTPLAVGASMKSGNITLDVAPLANVLPWIQTAAQMVVPSSWQSVQKILSSSVDRSVTFSAGPVWEYQQCTNKGYFRLFSGLALNF